MKIEKKLMAYYFTAIFSLILSIVGFSYNAWRMQATEDNNNIRTASFEVLTTLSEFEQIIYAAHYDHDKIEGNPRKGWVKIGLIVDLSSLISESVEKKALELKNMWAKNWEKLEIEQSVASLLVMKIGLVRKAIKLQLKKLR